MDKKTKGLIIAGLAIVGGICIYKMVVSKKSGTSNFGGRRNGSIRAGNCNCAIGQDGAGNIVYKIQPCPCSGHDTSTLITK